MADSTVFTDKQAREQRRRIERYANRWYTRLGLNHWRIEHTFHRGVLGSDADGENALAETHADWRYLHGNIEWNVLSVADTDDEDLEQAVIHELVHLLTHEVQTYAEGEGKMNRGQTERTATALTLAFWWSYQAGLKEGRRVAKK